MLTGHLCARAAEYGWELQAWSVFSNHYHFVALSPDAVSTLSRMLGHIHTLTARELNREDNTPGRKVWFQYWDTHLTYQASYMARLKYVHYNPVRHNLARAAEDYPWCSAGWLAEHARPSFVRSILSFKTDRIVIHDEFDPILSET